MPDQQFQWQVLPTVQPPEWFIEEVKRYTTDANGMYAAQLLWQRGIQDKQQLAGFLNPRVYQAASPFEFKPEMQWATARLRQARESKEIVAIWGDFDADGITSTSVLWEGLGQFFPQNQQLCYYIPNRLTESHGLNIPGIDNLAEKGIKLIVTCDTGSTNIKEIEYANQLGIDVIVTDHHTLPDERPPVTAIINPRYLPLNHPLYNLSGVAVAYKLVEALYETLPDVPQQPVEDLLDLVAIGLIADLVKLTGDCRYLAQVGIEQLQKQSKTQNIKSKITRPGISLLLELCQRSGDRPTDISFGIGPRINAVSRIQGDASFCVELLTSKDEKRCQQLAYDTELANARRKSLQKDVVAQVKQKLGQMDLSTTSVIVLCDEQWPMGVLGLVAGQIAQEYGRPTILLSTAVIEEEVGEWGSRGVGEEKKDKEDKEDKREFRIHQSSVISQQSSVISQQSSVISQQSTVNSHQSSVISHQSPVTNPKIARGSARSVNEIDLYQLLLTQAHLLHRFGGHPLAAGLSLLEENIPLFTEAINQQVRQLSATTGTLTVPIVQADIICSVRDLGKELFRELKLLEPCGMGNPVPKILIENCWFENVWNRNTQDFKGRKIQYIKTEFEIWDESTDIGFPGLWWGHYKEELPQGQCDAIVEIDYNNFKKRAEVRLIAVRSRTAETQFNIPTQIDLILDWRNRNEADLLLEENKQLPITVKECPHSWDELQIWFRRAIQNQKKLAIAYTPPTQLPPVKVWEQLIGIAKYLSRTGKTATIEQMQDKLGISDRALYLGLQALKRIGFQIAYQDNFIYKINWHLDENTANSELENGHNNYSLFSIKQFLAAVREEQFYQRYFYTVPLSTIQAIALQTVGNF